MKNAVLYETHVKTRNLEKAISFYEKLDLELAYVLNDRRVAFFYLGNASKREQMLGVWEVKEEHFVRSHFAFYVPFPVLLTIPDFLKERGIKLSPSFSLDTSEPVVHAWMPSACYYFSDPDSNNLEYLTLLDDEPQPELGVVHLSDWKNRSIPS